MWRGEAAGIEEGSIQQSGATAMIGAEAGAMGDNVWIGGGCTEPVVVGWQALLLKTVAA
jgi:actin-like ATPase involved in cell morphogenesis